MSASLAASGQLGRFHVTYAWGNLAEYAAPFRKGAHLEIEGELRSREYENKGVQVRTYDIVASSILSIRPGQRNGAQESEAAPAPAATDEDVPF